MFKFCKMKCKFSLLLLIMNYSLALQAPFGKKFIYDYQGQVATGVTDKSINQFSGFNLKATVEVQWQLERQSVYFKLSNAKFEEFNDKAADFQRLWDLPMNNAIGPEVEEYIKELEEPFWITAGPQGTVNIEHGKQWEETSNFKLSLAALFQLIIKKLSKEYTEIEEGITGRCPVNYRLTKELDAAAANHSILYITKIVLYDKCENRPHKLHYSIHGHKCEFCDDVDDTPLKTFGRTDYQIRVEKHEDTSETMSFEKIDATGTIIFTPFGSDGATVLSLTNQTLKLVAMNDQMDDHPEDLIAEPAVGFIFPAEHHQTNVFLSQAKKQLPDMIKVYDTFDTQSLTIMEFVLFFRKFTFDDFASFFSAHVNFNINSSTVREGEIRIALLQALSLAGTEASLQYIMHLISEKTINRFVAAELIRIVPSHLNSASYALVSTFNNFTRATLVDDVDDVLNEALLLAYGSVIHKHCNQIQIFPNDNSRHTNLETCKQLLQDLINEFHSSTSLDYRLIILRTILNTNIHPEVLYFCVVIISLPLPDVLRRVAIWGLLQANSPQKVQLVEVIIRQIVFNASEDYLMRIYAFEGLIYLIPKSEVFNQLIFLLDKEPNQQFASYIYSTLITMANATDPCLRSLSLRSKEALKLIKSRRYDTLRYSKNKVFSYYNSKHDFGRTFQICHVANNESLFPREVYIGHRLRLFGYNFNLVEMIISPGNVDALLQQIKVHPFSKKESSHSNSFLQKLYTLLPIKRRKGVRQFPRFALMNLGQNIVNTVPFGHKGAHCLYERNNIDENADLFNFDILMRCIKFSFMDAQLTIPNDMGFLTRFQLHIPLVYKMGFRAKGFFHKHTFKLLADFHFKFGTNFMINPSVFVEGPKRRKYGYSLQTRGGLKVSIIVKEAESNFKKFDYHPTTKPYTIFFYNTRGQTFSPRTSLPVALSSESKKTYSFGHDYLGLGLTFNLTYDSLWNDYESYRDIIKSFLHKSSRHEDYSEWTDKIFAGLGGFFDFLLLNPSGKPMDFVATFSRHPETGTDKFTITSDVTVSSISPITTEKKLNLKISAKGSANRNFECEIGKYSSLQPNNRLKMSFFCRGSSIPHLDEKETQFCLQIDSNTSDSSEYLNNPLKSALTAPSFNSVVLIGSACTDVGLSKLEVKGRQIAANYPDSFTYFKRCKMDKDRSFEHSLPCWLLAKQRGRLDDFRVTFDYKEISDAVKSYARALLSWLDYQLYNNLEIVDSCDDDEDGQIRVHLGFLHSPFIDIDVTTPRDCHRYRHVFLPVLIPHFESISVINSPLDRFLENALYIHQPKCVIGGDYIQTTDGVIYKYELSACYHVILADCAEKRLVILMKKSTTTAKAMRVLFDSDNVEIDGEIAQVNGVKILQQEKTWYSHYINTSNTFNVYKHLEQFVIEAPLLGVKVRFDGRGAVISVTNWLRGVQCGLCGDFDGETTSEFEAPDGKVFINGAQFAKSYAFIDEECA